MPHYMLAAHSREGDAGEAMTAEDQPAAWQTDLLVGRGVARADSARVARSTEDARFAPPFTGVPNRGTD
jgi:hypothetical protein